MPAPYIFSRRSKRVISNDRGGRRQRLFFFTVDGLNVDWDFEEVALASATESSASESPSLEDFTSSTVVTSAGSSMGSLVFGAGAVFLLFFSVLLGDLSIERIVGGNCIGSPANISFFDLKIGTQQTYISTVNVKRISSMVAQTYGL
jgi:hypothetical protein